MSSVPRHTVTLRQAVPALLLAAILGVAAGNAGAQPVAIVTDASGRVTGPGPIGILAELAADARVSLESGSSLVVLYLASGTEYHFSGPAEVRFAATEPVILSGAAARRRSTALGRNAGALVRPSSVAQGAYVIRGAGPSANIRLLAPAGTRLLDAPREFRWQEVEPGLTYRFELTDERGRAVHDAEIRATAFVLPAAVELRRGSTYTWAVSARSRDARRFVSVGEFVLVSAPVRAQAESLRPGPGAALSERVAYAVWLDREDLRDEARMHWRALAAERPGEAQLKARAGE